MYHEQDKLLNLEDKIQNDSDFILLKRFNYSLRKFVEKNPDRS